MHRGPIRQSRRFTLSTWIASGAHAPITFWGVRPAAIYKLRFSRTHWAAFRSSEVRSLSSTEAISHPIRHPTEAEAEGATHTGSKAGGSLRTDKACAAELEKVLKLLQKRAISAPAASKPLPPGLQEAAGTHVRIEFEDDTPRREFPRHALIARYRPSFSTDEPLRVTVSDAITALYPHRRKSDRAVPERRVFQVKAGRPSASYMYNSCFPLSAKTRAIDPANLLPSEVILTAERRAPGPANIPDFVSLKSTFASKDALTLSTKCTKWGQEHRPLSGDEVGVFMEAMNSCNARLGLRTLFLDAATAKESRSTLAPLNWAAKPGDDNEEAVLVSFRIHLSRTRLVLTCVDLL